MKNMKTFFIALFLICFVTSANAATCSVKAVKDSKDGAVYYDKDHRLHKYVKLNKSKGDKTFCSEREAENAGYDEAPKTFSNSTARLVECVEKGVKSCVGYVMGQYQSLDIYGKACGGNKNKSQIVSNFLEHTKSDKNRMDVAKFYGTTSALMEAYPCGGSTVARK